MVEVEILDVSQDQENGTIIVKTNYKLDGIEVVSNYPKFNGKYYWVTRYNVSSFAGLDDQQTKDKIFVELNNFADNLIIKEYYNKNNLTYVQNKAPLLVGQKSTKITADIRIDSNTVWTVSSDGTKIDVASPIIP